MLKQHSIARSQYRVLHFVDRHSKPTQTDIMDAMEVKASTLTLIIDGMVKKGWITRAKGSKDKRTNELKLTAEGEIIFKLIPDPVIKLNKDIQKIITKEEAITLEKALKKIIDEL